MSVKHFSPNARHNYFHYFSFPLCLPKTITIFFKLISNDIDLLTTYNIGVYGSQLFDDFPLRILTILLGEYIEMTPAI